MRAQVANHPALRLAGVNESLAATRPEAAPSATARQPPCRVVAACMTRMTCRTGSAGRLIPSAARHHGCRRRPASRGTGATGRGVGREPGDPVQPQHGAVRGRVSPAGVQRRSNHLPSPFFAPRGTSPRRTPRNFKMIKRQMYGRAGSDLLSKRGILHRALPESQTLGRAYFRVDANVRTSR